VGHAGLETRHEAPNESWQTQNLPGYTMDHGTAARRTDRPTARPTDRRPDRQTDRRADRQTDHQTDGKQTDGRMDGQTVGQTDGRTDKWPTADTIIVLVLLVIRTGRLPGHVWGISGRREIIPQRPPSHQWEERPYGKKT
jgi:hypothetical protein